jgi:hypothetical protein
MGMISVQKGEAMAEKRRQERFDLVMPAAIELINEAHDERVINLLTTNICSGGAYFHTTQPLPEGTKVKLDLVLPLENLMKKIKKEDKKAFIKVTGKVLRTESEGMAICFDKDYQITGSPN